MPTGLERLKEEFTKPWDCGGVMTNPLLGAGNGCEKCVIQIASIVTAVMGVQLPKKREPGPKVPMTSDRSMAGALYDKCRELGHVIGDAVPPGSGFCLMLFEFNGHKLEYICNAQRPDMIKLLAEFHEVLEKEQRS